MHWRLGGILIDHFIANFLESDGERILKSYQYLMKLLQKLGGLLFDSHCVSVIYIISVI